MRGEPIKAGNHRPTSEMTFRWRANGGPTFECWLGSLGRTSNDQEPHSFVIFQGADPRSSPLQGRSCMCEPSPVGLASCPTR